MSTITVLSLTAPFPKSIEQEEVTAIMPYKKYSPILRWFSIWTERFRVPVYRDMAIYLAILLTCGFYAIYFSRIEKFLPLIRVGLAFLFGFVAMWLGFCNGFWGRISFPIMATVSAVVPGILFWITNSMDVDHGFGGFIFDLSVLLFQWPFEMTQKMFSKVFFRIPLSLTAFLPVLNVWFFFAIGWLVKARFFQTTKH